jgi:aspartyl-tRNA(Asn)/glutamyl-tRNA(Gln) amidotransferase subunit C
MKPDEKGDSAITRDEILHLGKLASLPLTEAEIVALAKDLGGIIGHVQHVLTASAAAGSAPVAAHGAGSLDALRADNVAPGLSHEDALAAAPETADGGFSVPTFVSG